MDKNEIARNRFLKVEEAAPIANIKPFRFYELIRRGDIPNSVVVRLGERQIRINEQRLIEWLNNGGTVSQPEEIEEKTNLRIAA